MTVDELVELATQYKEPFAGSHPLDKVIHDILTATVALLSTPEPCGWAKPTTGLVADGRPFVDWEAIKDALSPDDARGIAIMLLRAADEAER